MLVMQDALCFSALSFRDIDTEKQRERERERERETQLSQCDAVLASYVRSLTLTLALRALALTPSLAKPQRAMCLYYCARSLY